MPEFTDFDQDIADAMMTGDVAEVQLLREAKRLGLDKHPKCPDRCPNCGGELQEGEGMVGETIMYCNRKDCKGFMWENAMEALRIVY